MPYHIELFFFEPSVKDLSTSPILALHGGPAIAPPETLEMFSNAAKCLYRTNSTSISTSIYRQAEGTTLRMHLVGHSFGGFIATLYAAEFPHHVQFLTLLEPAGVMKFPNPESDLFAKIQQALQAKNNIQELQEYNQWYQNEFMDFLNIATTN